MISSFQQPQVHFGAGGTRLLKVKELKAALVNAGFTPFEGKGKTMMTKPGFRPFPLSHHVNETLNIGSQKRILDRAGLRLDQIA